MSEAGEGAGGGVAVAQGGGRRVWLFLPLLGFLALAVLFFFRLGAGDPSRIPSALINKPVPDFSLPPIIEGSGGGLADEDLAAGVHVVNVWGSWCGPCRLEHPVLMRLAADPRFELVGINQKDVPENAVRFLGALGNPFDRIGADRDGRASIEWGVYGVPETFIVKDGVIMHKFVGPLSEQGLASDFLPALEDALGG
ncbi:MAG: DsbE family thiol:disulfide interchange protein [Rhizobiales bacterium]|nr:DsbE family thiol:disulfide interchange protein [Hyphomicrobiales bacterium]